MNPHVTRHGPTLHASRVTRHGSPAPLALIGAKGMLAGMVRRVAPAGYEVHPYDLPEFDLTDRERVLGEMGRLEPRVIVNCAAYTDVDGCETREELATRVNGHGPGYLAEAARETGATLVHLSTDYVFDGGQREPYLEEDRPAPRSAYGRSKLAGERAIEASGLRAYFTVRTSWLYGPGGRNFVETIARLARERDELRVVADQVGTPTYTEDLARAIFELLALPTRHASPIYGLYHFANEGRCSWHEFAVAIVDELRSRGPVKARVIHPIATAEYPLPAPRPAYSVLSKAKYQEATGALVPHWREGLKRYFEIRDA